MLSPMSMFPASWFCDVVVLRGGGRDARGNPMPETEIPVAHCLVAARASSEAEDMSELVDGTAVLYHEPLFKVLPSDRIRIPEGARMAGVWEVAGRPSEWPFGVEVPLKQGGDS